MCRKRRKGSRGSISSSQKRKWINNNRNTLLMSGRRWWILETMLSRWVEWRKRRNNINEKMKRKKINNKSKSAAYYSLRPCLAASTVSPSPHLFMCIHKSKWMLLWNDLLLGLGGDLLITLRTSSDRDDSACARGVGDHTYLLINWNLLINIASDY